MQLVCCRLFATRETESSEPEVVREPDPEPGEIVDEWGADDEPEDDVETWQVSPGVEFR